MPSTRLQKHRPPLILDCLYFPKEIAHEIGLAVTAIGALKFRGCPFIGKKTTIRWVRDFLAKEAGAIPSYREEVGVYQFFDNFVELVRARLEAKRR